MLNRIAHNRVGYWHDTVVCLSAML